MFVAVVNFQRGSIKIDTTHSPRPFIGNFINMQMSDIYVIHRPGGPYREKLCPRSRGLEYMAEGRTRDRGQSFSQYGPTEAGE